MNNPSDLSGGSSRTRREFDGKPPESPREDVPSLVVPRLGTWRCACPMCETAADSTPAYFKRAFGEPRHLARTSEGIANALGFCPRHGAELLMREPLRLATAQVFELVVPQVLPLLADARFGDEKFLQVYFSAPHACPACAYEHRAVARQAARLGTKVAAHSGHGEGPDISHLCNAHFQLMARTLAPERRMPALGAHAEALDRAVRAVEDMLKTGIPAETPLVELTALSTTLGMAAGSGGACDATVALPLAESLQTCPDFEQAVERACACAVCVEVERSRQRWLIAVPLAVAHALDDWLFLPTCPEHVALAAGLGDIAVTAAVAAHALRAAGELAHQQLRTLVRAAESEAEQAAARIVRWGRRPRRRKSEPRKPPLPKIVRCAACERLAIAELHATGHLLRWLQGGGHRHAFEGGWGLCMKHHAQAYLMSPKGAVRSFLAADQARRLSEFVRWLEDEQDSLAQNQSSRPAKDAYVLALRRFCGFG
jgi:hypothetical protein